MESGLLLVMVTVCLKSAVWKSRLISPAVTLTLEGLTTLVPSLAESSSGLMRGSFAAARVAEVLMLFAPPGMEDGTL